MSHVRSNMHSRQVTQQRIPERFSRVWATIMGRRHSGLDATVMRAVVERFTVIPAEESTTRRQLAIDGGNYDR